MLKKITISLILFIGYYPIYAQRGRGHDGRGIDGPDQSFGEWLIFNLKFLGIIALIFIVCAIYFRIKEKSDKDK